MNGRGEVGSPDPLDSFPRLRVRESDGASRRSSFGGDSELERYCSANSMTPSTSMSMCSAITVFHDFSDIDFGSARGFDDGTSGLENFSLGGGGIATETNRNDRKRNLRYGSSGLELYGDGGDELAMTALDSSELIGFNRTGESEGNENDGEIEKKEMEREEDEDFSEGEDSMFNYGSGCDGDNENENENKFYLRRVDNGENEFYSSRSEQLYEEAEVRNESTLLMNSSVAFGSHDLDDFFLQNGPVSPVSDLFHNPRGNNQRVEEDGVSSSQKEKDVVIVNEEVEETKDVFDTEAKEEDNDRGREIPAACCELQGADKLVGCSKTSSSCEGNLGLLPEEDLQKSLNVSDGGSEEKGNQYINSDEAGATVDSRVDHFCDSRVDESSSNPSASVGNMNAKSFENLKQTVLPSNFGVRKILESSPTSTNHLEKSPVTSTVSNESHCLLSYRFQSCLIFVFVASICTILINVTPTKVLDCSCGRVVVTVT